MPMSLVVLAASALLGPAAAPQPGAPAPDWDLTPGFDVADSKAYAAMTRRMTMLIDALDRDVAGRPISKNTDGTTPAPAGNLRPNGSR